jgi:hypothetical protein
MSSEGEKYTAVREALRERLCGFEDNGDKVIRVELLGSLDEIAEAITRVLSTPTTEAQRKEVHEYDGSRYEADPTMHNMTTCAVWALHLCVPEDQYRNVLDRMAMHEVTTGEYTYGDSWTTWGEEAQHSQDKHLTVYFRADGPDEAIEVGDYLATSAMFAGKSVLGGTVSVSGDWAEQL